MDVLCELNPVEMTAILASKRIFAAAATGGARTAELPISSSRVSNVTKSSYMVWNRIISTGKLFDAMYPFVIVMMR